MKKSAGICSVLLVAAAALAMWPPRLHAAAPAAGQALSFRHIGPEDKPLPAFRLTLAGATVASRGGDDAVPTLAAAPATWHRIIALLAEGQAAAPAPLPFGAYRVDRVPQGSTVYLAPPVMRRIVAVLESDTGLAKTGPELLAGLRRRLAAPLQDH